MTRRQIKHRIEGVLVAGLMALFLVLPLDAASTLGGMLGRWVGPRTGIHRKAIRQMAEILSDLPIATIKHHIRDMWDNLGRTMAEYPHLAKIAATRVTFENRAGFTATDLSTRPSLFIGGHFANWEVAAPALLHFYQTPLDLVYRRANNPFVDDILKTYRSLHGKLVTIPKSRNGVRDMIGTLQNNRALGLLIDQKYNEGIVADFFGKPATASTAFVQLGQKYNCPVYPSQIVRQGGARFHIIIYPALDLYAADGTPRAAEDVVADIHHMMESWMRAHPAQWLWVHQRWSSARMRS